MVYIRYRWGWLEVSESVHGRSRTIFGREIGGGYDGTMSEEDMLRITGLEWAGER